MTDSKFHIDKLCIFGVGLIGGSLALALKKAGVVGHVVGCSRNEAHLQQAIALGVIDSYSLDPEDAAKNADVVLLAVPMGAMSSVLESFKSVVTDSMVITDAGSAKQSVANAAIKVFGHLPDNFVLAHPIAGREKSSVNAAETDLYVDHRVIITPEPTTEKSAVEIVSQMWTSCGAIVETMSVEHHDRVLAATSHLPHVIAYALVNTLAGMQAHEEVFKYAAGGFKDFTRIASSDPVMWRDICLENQQALLLAVDAFKQQLTEIETSIENADAEAMHALFSLARDTRDNAVSDAVSTNSADGAQLTNREDAP